MTARRVALIPGVLALRAQYAGIDDPLPELRKAVREAVAWLDAGAGPTGEIAVYCTWQQLAFAKELLAPYGRRAGSSIDSPPAVLAIANGSACRGEKAPGFFDPRAEAFDAQLAAALVKPDPSALRKVDEDLGAALLADVEAIRSLGGSVLVDEHQATVVYDDDPFGVQYWVMRWELPDGD